MLACSGSISKHTPTDDFAYYINVFWGLECPVMQPESHAQAFQTDLTLSSKRPEILHTMCLHEQVFELICGQVCGPQDPESDEECEESAPATSSEVRSFFTVMSRWLPTRAGHATSRRPCPCSLELQQSQLQGEMARARKVRSSLS